jgi:hypothetical protein
VNLQKERKIPYKNGTINPIANAIMVGSANTTKYFLIPFSITVPF